MDGTKERKYLCLSGFWLKVIAIVTMTMDHIGIAIGYSEPFGAGYILRIFGRLAFPIFALLLAEGLKHTHSRGKYILRLTGVWALVLAASAVIRFGFGYRDITYQAFSDLLPYALFIYLIEHKNKKLRPLAILPLGYIVASYVLVVLSKFDGFYDIFNIFVGGYSLMGFLIFLGFYYSDKLAAIFLNLDKVFENQDDLKEAYKESKDFRLFSNLTGALIFIVVTCAFYLLEMLTREGSNALSPYDAYYMPLQSWSLLCAVLIVCYSGKRGYNAKWFQYGSYLYYPLHIALIFGIAALL